MHSKSVALVAALTLATTVIAEPERPRFYYPHKVKREYFNTTITSAQTLPPAENTHTTSSTKKDTLTDILSHIFSDHKPESSLPHIEEPSVTTIVRQSTIYVLPTSRPPPIPVRPTTSEGTSFEQTPTVPDSAIVVGPTGIFFPDPIDTTSSGLPSTVLGNSTVSGTSSVVPPTSVADPNATTSVPATSVPIRSVASTTEEAASSTIKEASSSTIKEVVSSTIKEVASSTTKEAASSTTEDAFSTSSEGLLDPIVTWLTSALPIFPTQSSTNSTLEPTLSNTVDSTVPPTSAVETSAPASSQSQTVSEPQSTATPSVKVPATTSAPDETSFSLSLIPTQEPSSLLGITVGFTTSTTESPATTQSASTTESPSTISAQDPTSIIGVTGITTSAPVSETLTEVPSNATVTEAPNTTSAYTTPPTTVPLTTSSPDAPIANTTSTEITSAPTSAPTLTSLPTTAPTDIPVTNGTTSQEPTSAPVTSTVVSTSVTESIPETSIPTTSVVQTSIIDNSTTAYPTATVTSEPTTVTKAPTTSVEETSVPTSTVAVYTTSSVSSEAERVTSIRPTATLTNTADWLPTTIVIEPTTMTFSAPTQSQTQGTSTTALPTGIPKIILPDDPNTPAPEGTVLLQIGFLYPLNYVFVSNNTVAAAQIFKYLPQALADAASFAVDKVQISKLLPYDTRDNLGYVTTLAQFNYPQHLVEKLQMDLWSPNSLLYNNADAIVRSLTAQINPKISLFGDKNTGGPTGGAGSPPPAGSGNDAFGNNSGGPADNQSSKQKATTAGIAVGAVSLGAVYGIAMFIVARRYKRKRQAHRRASSIGGSEASSEMRYAGNGSPALMGGALLSREASSYGGVAGARNSHGSGGSSSARTGRTANISAPVAAENSLGWN
ncbi:Cell surface sensor MSB2 [Cladobotryum mycophilum]|uniref:Cell surface sensor MSB2 n=1 Tax=Cladobotryum mycophilum TaxID=491253 RepID=A0ABR0SAY3_9HYPO